VKQLSQIEELDLNRVELTAEGLRALLRSKHLTGLKTLSVANNAIGDAGAEALAAWPGLQRLESLDVSGCELGAEGFEHLFTTKANIFKQLRRLHIGRNQITPRQVYRLTMCDHLKRLKELELAAAEVGPEEAHLFNYSVFGNTLTHLDLESATFTVDAFERFIRCPLPALRVLKLNNVNLNYPAASQLANAAFRKSLEELHLDNCGLKGASGHFFYQAKFPNLRTLDVSRNRIELYGLGMLVSHSMRFPALTNLRLWDNRLTPQAVATLARSKVLANITDLDLSGNKIGPAGAVALAKSKYLKKLTNLAVDEKTVGKTGKKALLDRFGEGVVSFR
jgi:Ran GTPase-activating protein (RanGAP) involved in mRNA processing and transport